MKSSPKDAGANAKNKHEGQASNSLYTLPSKFNSLRQVILLKENPSSENQSPRNLIYDSISFNRIPKRSKSIKDLVEKYFEMKFSFDAISNGKIFEDDAPDDEPELEVDEDNKD